MSDAPTSAEPQFNFLEEMDIESMNLEELKEAIAQFDISLVENPAQWERFCFNKNLSAEKKNCIGRQFYLLKAEHDYMIRQNVLNNLMMIKRKLASFLAQSSIEKSFEISVKGLQKTFSYCDFVMQKLSDSQTLWKRFDREVSNIPVISSQIFNKVNEQKDNLTERQPYYSRKTDEFRRLKSECCRFWDDVQRQIKEVNAIKGCWAHVLKEEVSWVLINFPFKWTNDGYQEKYETEPEKRLWSRRNAVTPADLLRKIELLQEKYCRRSTARTSKAFMIDSILKRIQL